MSAMTLTNDQLDTLDAVVRDLHGQANAIAPVGLVASGLVDPNEITHRDMLQAQALADYADRLEGLIAQRRYENSKGGAAA